MYADDGAVGTRGIGVSSGSKSDASTGHTTPPPGIQVSSGAMIFDHAGRLLILKPTYKSGWTLPGGVMEADGETPWDACRREVREECGIKVEAGQLAAMDFRPARPGRPGGIRFFFDCGQASEVALAGIELQAEEISEARLVALEEALTMLRGPISRRVQEAMRSKRTVYLEDGQPVPGVDGDD
jgi:8-oxo-dGTP diphosphatase